MLRLSKRADYALMALKHLAQHGERGAASAREIAACYDIPVELMAKVLQLLARRRLVASHHGTHGGYRLSRPATSISVADVINAIDGSVAVTACSAGEAVRDPLFRLKERIERMLHAYTIADLATEPSPDPGRPVALTGARVRAVEKTALDA
jgi:Rrf2 family protein